MNNMPQRDDETVDQWRARALEEATAADSEARPYIVLGTEHPADGPVSPEHAAFGRWSTEPAKLVPPMHAASVGTILVSRHHVIV
jgi:hypothetical protein